MTIKAWILRNGFGNIINKEKYGRNILFLPYFFSFIAQIFLLNILQEKVKLYSFSFLQIQPASKR